MKVQVIRSNRKTIGLEVRADESVILRAPQWLSEKELDEWIGEHAYWIEEKVKQMRQRNLEMEIFCIRQDFLWRYREFLMIRLMNFSSLLQKKVW